MSVHYCQIPEIGREASMYIESSYKRKPAQYELKPVPVLEKLRKSPRQTVNSAKLLLSPYAVAVIK